MTDTTGMAQGYVELVSNVMVSKTYNGHEITFNRGDNLLINATQMAKPFGKEAKHWLGNTSTKEFIAELSKVRNLTFDNMVIIRQGSPENGGGTWMHEDVAMEFARWLSPAFAIWTNDRIKELLTQGVKSTREPSRKELALMVIQAEEEKERLMLENRVQAEKIAEDAPKVEFHDKIIASEDTCLIRELAKILAQRGFKIGQNRLYELLRNEGYLIKSGSDRNQPTQQYVEDGIFEVDRKPWTNPKTGEVHVGKTSKVTSKGIKYFVRKFLGRAAL